NDYANIVGRNVTVGYYVGETYTQADVQPEIDRLEGLREIFENIGIDVDSLIATQQDLVGTRDVEYITSLWEIDDEGKYSRANHPCLTTNVDLISCGLSSEIIDND
ncbi:TonB-dependent receptor, partial [Marinomonas rhizomae]|uniref:hypothetical protein n=1 Tax=Marinomonas rhizomae TaxID=491948 RepID=UPI000F3D8EE0